MVEMVPMHESAGSYSLASLEPLLAFSIERSV